MRITIWSLVLAGLSFVTWPSLIVPPAGASVGPVTLGAAFDVATAASQGEVTGTAAAALPGNRFVVAWTIRIASPQPAVQVRAAVVTVDGALLGPSFAVSGDGGRWPVVSASPDGGFAIGWTQHDQFWARVFDSDIQPLSSAFRIDRPSDPLTGRIGTVNDGRTYDLGLVGNRLFASWVTDVETVWRPFAPRTPANELRVISLTNTGTPLVAQPISIKHAAVTEMYTPNVVVGDGQFAVTWTVGGDLHLLRQPLPNAMVGRATVRFQRFSFSMDKLGGDNVVAYPLDNSPTMSAAMNRADEYVLAWRATVNTRFRLTSQAYGANGAGRLFRQEISVQEDGSISKTAPSVDLDESGAYAVVWTDPIGSASVLLQLYRPAVGTGAIKPAGESLRVAAGAEPSVAMGDAGVLGVFWVEIDNGFKAIRGQLFSY